MKIWIIIIYNFDRICPSPPFLSQYPLSSQILPANCGNLNIGWGVRPLRFYLYWAVHKHYIKNQAVPSTDTHNSSTTVTSSLSQSNYSNNVLAMPPEGRSRNRCWSTDSLRQRPWTERTSGHTSNSTRYLRQTDHPIWRQIETRSH